MTAKPTKFPEWARTPSVDPVVGGDNIVEPAEQLKDTGWLRKQKPPANQMNWLFNLINQWIEYHDGEFSNYIQTGDVKASYRRTVEPGMDGNWVIMDDGTISKGGGGGTTRDNDDTEALFLLLWENVQDAYCPVAGGRTTAPADFDAGKQMTLPQALGRALCNVGGTPTAYIIGQAPGAQTHQLTVAELAAHAHDVSLVTDDTNKDGDTDPTVFYRVATTTGITGGDQPHNNIQESMFLNFYIKL